MAPDFLLIKRATLVALWYGSATKLGVISGKNRPLAVLHERPSNSLTLIRRHDVVLGYGSRGVMRARTPKSTLRTGLSGACRCTERMFRNCIHRFSLVPVGTCPPTRLSVRRMDRTARQSQRARQLARQEGYFSKWQNSAFDFQIKHLAQ